MGSDYSSAIIGDRLITSSLGPRFFPRKHTVRSGCRNVFDMEVCFAGYPPLRIGSTKPRVKAIAVDPDAS